MGWEQEIFNRMHNTGNQQKQSQLSKEERRYKWNCIIFEIATNWDEVRRLMKKKDEGNLKQVYKIDNQWINFLSKNKINVFEFGEDESERFIKFHYRNPNN